MRQAQQGTLFHDAVDDRINLSLIISYRRTRRSKHLDPVRCYKLSG